MHQKLFLPAQTLLCEKAHRSDGSNPSRRRKAVVCSCRVCSGSRWVRPLERISGKGKTAVIGLVAFSSLCCTDATTPLFTKPPYLQSVTETSIIICWESDVPSDAAVEYWVEGSQVVAAETVQSNQRHEIQLRDLQAGTAYGYRVKIPAEGEGSCFTAGFRTAPVEDAPFTFAVYGDSREQDETEKGHKSVAEAIRRVNPAFVVHTGDLVYQGDSDQFWNIFWGAVAPPDGNLSLAGNSPIYPAVGNHEYKTATGYADEGVVGYQSYFVLPPNGLEAEHPEWNERFYSFRYGPVFFIILDLNNDSDPQYDPFPLLSDPRTPDIHPGSAQYQWLIGQLQSARTQSPFTFVCFHPSPYSSGPWGENSSYRLRFLDAIFRQYGVDAVFTSHDHFYERCETHVEDYGIPYFVTGAGGAPPYSRRPGWDKQGSWMWDELTQSYYSKAFDRSSCSFVKVDVTPLGRGAWRATFSATRPNGEVFDVVQITRPWRYVTLKEGLRFSFEVVAGETYQAEYSDGPVATEMQWLSLGEPIVADGPFVHVTDDGTKTGVPPAHESVRHRFYRAFALP